MIRAAVALLLAASPAMAEPARVVRMSDGDSGRLEIRGVVTTVRLMDLDTPETGSHARCAIERQRGEAAKRYAFTILPPGKLIDFRAKAGRPDKYGRALGWITVDGRDYAAHMREVGHGVMYRGGRKPNWCDT